MLKYNILKKKFTNIGLHLGGEISKSNLELTTWGTYDLNTVAIRETIPFYDIDNVWKNTQHTLSFLQNSSKNRDSKFFFGSLTDNYAIVLKEASGRCNATFYGDSSSDWKYGQYTNFLIEDRVDAVYLPDIVMNDAVFREFNPSVSVVIGIRTADSMSNIDFPLIGNSQNLQHFLYYTHLVGYTVARVLRQFVCQITKYKI